MIIVEGSRVGSRLFARAALRTRFRKSHICRQLVDCLFVGDLGAFDLGERGTLKKRLITAGPRPSGGWEVEALLRDCKAPAPA